MSKHIIEDAKRCLQCRTPRCSLGCPVRTPIRDAIHLLLESKIAEAGELLFQNNPLSLVCCHVCPQENQCEGHCVLGKTGSPVQISAIERYISEYYLHTHKPPSSTKDKGKVAIIGSGPAGIAIAFILSQKNYEVTIFEGNDKIGGILQYGIPEFRLPKRILERLKETLLESGVKIRPNTTIGAIIGIDDLLRDGFQAIFMGTGAWRSHKLGIRGESLGHVHYAIEYLKNPEVYRLGKRLAVIGAGNTAMDVARTALRHGCEDVFVICHMDESDVTAYDIEKQFARIDGVEFIFRQSAVEITEEGIILADNEICVCEDGQREARRLPGTEELFRADSVIIAIGQAPRAVIAPSPTGTGGTDEGLLAVDAFGHTGREGVFASVDVVTGAKTVVEAVKISRRIAEAMDAYCVEKAKAQANEA